MPGPRPGARYSKGGCNVVRRRPLHRPDARAARASCRAGRRRGAGVVLLITGEAGSGKSRLVDEFLRSEATEDVTVLTGRSWEAGGAPVYWPWRQALRTMVRDLDPDRLRTLLGSGKAEVARIVPEVAEVLGEPIATSPADSDGARFRMFDATAEFLQRASAERHVLLVLDDIDRADEPSMLLARFVARQVERSAITFVLTGRDQPTGGTLEIERDLLGANGRQLALDGLARADVSRLFELLTGSTPADDLVRKVHGDTGGNALFVSEVVRLLADKSGAPPESEIIASPLAVPSTVAATILGRIERLSTPCRRVLELASVIGREADLALLAELASCSIDELLAIIDEAIRAGVVETWVGMPMIMRFSHGLVRDVLLATLPAPRRIRLHGEIGALLEARHREHGATPLAQIAHHFIEAAPGGDVERAIDFADRAARQALLQYGYEDAIRLYERALELTGATLPSDEARSATLLLGLGDALSRAGDLAKAREQFRRAARLARRHGLDDVIVDAALGYGGRWTWGRAANDPYIIPMLRDAIERLGEVDSARRVRALGRLACALRGHRDREVGARLAAEAVAMADRLGDSETIAYALDAQAGSTYWYDNPEERLARADSARQAVALADEERFLNVLLGRSSALIELGRLGEADAQLDEMDRRAHELGQPAYQWMVVSIRAMLALLRGDVESAERFMASELEVGSAAITAEARSAHRAHDVWLRLESGRTDGLESDAAQAAQELWWYPMFRCLHAEVTARTGEATKARQLFEELAADDFAALQPRDNEWLVNATILADVCVSLDDASRAAFLYDELVPFGHLNATSISELSRGSVERCLGALATAMGRLDDAERHFERALASNTRLGARPWVARTQIDHARMLHRRGSSEDRTQAAALLETATQSAREIGLPGLLDRIGGEPSRRGRLDESAVFRCEGEYWTIEFGHDSFLLKDSKGLHHLSRLLQRSGQEIHVLELVAETPASSRITGQPEGVHGVGATDLPALDQRAKSEYRRRIADLEADIEQATDWNDPERVERARAELEMITMELRSALGLGGRDRSSASASERARINVTRAIRSALTRISAHSLPLASHLEATVHTGTFCSYTPDPRAPVSWDI